MNERAQRRVPHITSPAERLYPVLDADRRSAAELLELIEGAIRLGVRWFQLRAKRLADRNLIDLGDAVLSEFGAFSADPSFRLWINDRPDLASLLSPASVHLGQTDLRPAQARRLLGDAPLIGRSTHDRRQVLEAAADPEVDVVALGPIHPTSSKSDAEREVGLDHLAQWRESVPGTMVAIGGIGPVDASHVIRAGADRLAGIGAFGSLGGLERLVESLGSDDGRRWSDQNEKGKTT